MRNNKHCLTCGGGWGHHFLGCPETPEKPEIEDDRADDIRDAMKDRDSDRQPEIEN